LFRRGDRRALGQQIIRSIRRGTMMRHVIFAHPVTACPHRMIDATATARLITATGFTLRPTTRFPGTVCGAVHVAAIAIPADEHLHSAAQAQKEPGRRSGSTVVAIAPGMRGGRFMPWTHSPLGATMPLHSCPCTVSGTALMQTARLESAPCLPSSVGRFLSRQPTACQPRASENRLKIKELEESDTAAGRAIPSPSDRQS